MGQGFKEAELSLEGRQFEGGEVEAMTELFEAAAASGACADGATAGGFGEDLGIDMEDSVGRFIRGGGVEEGLLELGLHGKGSNGRCFKRACS